MSKIRHKKKQNFTTLDNTVVKDDSLTWKARGIFAYLWALPDDWDFYMNEVAKHSKDGKTALQSGIKELEEHGYLQRKMEHDKDGKMTSMVWELSDTAEYCQSANRSDGKTVKQKTRLTVNQPLLNKNITKEKNKLNKEDTNNNNQTSLIDRFSELWKLYPKKQGKQVAFRAYKRAVKKGTTDDEIKQGIVNYEKYIKVKRIDNQFIKQGSTWFNQGCWEDDYSVSNSNKPQEPERKWLF